MAVEIKVSEPCRTFILVLLGQPLIGIKTKTCVGRYAPISLRPNQYMSALRMKSVRRTPDDEHEEFAIVPTASRAGLQARSLRRCRHEQ
jgi:hypothetical protein